VPTPAIGGNSSVPEYIDGQTSDLIKEFYADGMVFCATVRQLPSQQCCDRAVVRPLKPVNEKLPKRGVTAFRSSVPLHVQSQL
jgi:hypothetical protein